MYCDKKIIKYWESERRKGIIWGKINNDNNRNMYVFTTPPHMRKKKKLNGQQ
jgi:hypothetical protein